MASSALKESGERQLNGWRGGVKEMSKIMKGENIENEISACQLINNVKIILIFSMLS
jgi:hypothetical protein